MQAVHVIPAHQFSGTTHVHHSRINMQKPINGVAILAGLSGTPIPKAQGCTPVSGMTGLPT